MKTAMLKIMWALKLGLLPILLFFVFFQRVDLFLPINDLYKENPQITLLFRA
jgi:hypothetical protein